MGTGKAVEYVSIIKSDLVRKFVVSVSPGSMKPKDEISEMNIALDLWGKQALDPITLFQKLNDPDPMKTAKKVALWVTNPQLYMLTYFPEQAQNPINSANPPNPAQPAPIPGQGQDSLSANNAPPQLSQVPINTP